MFLLKFLFVKMRIIINIFGILCDRHEKGILLAGPGLKGLSGFMAYMKFLGFLRFKQRNFRRSATLQIRRVDLYCRSSIVFDCLESL